MSIHSPATVEKRPLPARMALFERGLTVADFARFSRYSYEHARAVLQGHRVASSRFKKKLAEFLGVEQDALFPNGTETMAASR